MSIFRYERKYFLLLLAVFVTTNYFAQELDSNYAKFKNEENSGRFRFIEIKGHTGMHLYAGEGLEGKLDDGYGAVEVRFGWQPSSPEHWSSPYGQASYGVGWYSGFIGNPEIFGNPNAFYGFLNFHLSDPEKRHSLVLSPAFGLTYNLNPFDEEENPLNDAIGSKMAVYFNISFGGDYRVNREIDLIYGIDFTHFSNGRTYTPNYGLDMFGINLGMRYNYNADQSKVNNDPYTSDLLQARFKRPHSEKPDKLGENSINVYAAIGTVQNDEGEDTTTRYGTFSGVLEYRYKFNTISGVSAGFDLFYDESLAPDFPDNSDRYLVGVHAGYDFMFYRFAVRVQLGTYLGDDRGKDFLFIRPALQYEINKWMHAQVGLKTRNGAGADWIEFGIGFTPFKW
jgi:Lipid A 3-O-deacylase (PagL)